MKKTLIMKCGNCNREYSLHEKFDTKSGFVAYETERFIYSYMQDCHGCRKPESYF